MEALSVEKKDFFCEHGQYTHTSDEYFNVRAFVEYKRCTYAKPRGKMTLT